MPSPSFIDGTTIHVEFRFHVCLKFFVIVRLFKCSLKALAEIVVKGHYKRNRHFQRYVVSKPLA